MAKSTLPSASVRQVSSLVKKDIASLQAHADRLSAFLKSPGAAAIRICECCINVHISTPDPGETKTTQRGARRRRRK
jgi:hypothetical protein